jgi:flagellar biosynthesis/type III secretory pathway protein FliH
MDWLEIFVYTEGLNEGLEKGLKQGREQGREQGEKIGFMKGKISAIETLVAKKDFTLEQACKMFEMTPQQYLKEKEALEKKV